MLLAEIRQYTMIELWFYQKKMMLDFDLKMQINDR